MKKLFYLIACFGALSAMSQTVTPTVLSNHGGYAAAAQGSIQWTIGEPVSETYSTTSNLTTMGFHQPDVLGMANLIKQYGEGAGLLVYPNPVRETLIVNFKDLEIGNYKMQLVDDLGRILFQTEKVIKEDNKLADLNLSSYAAGSYFINITSSNLNKTVKITKVY
jgi:hypothetical protein